MFRNILIGLGLIGLADSLYLTWIKVAHNGVCSVSGGCEVVNTSAYASIGGIPIALLGAGAYLMMIAVLLLENRNEFFEFNGPMIVFGISLAGVLYSAYLTYLELYVIRAICPFCVVSAVVLILMLVVSGLRLRDSLRLA
ncbi:MAG: vitamin K epoxide reductase family protein [Anaerolineales bacterium]